MRLRDVKYFLKCHLAFTKQTWTLNPALDHLTRMPHLPPQNANMLSEALRSGEPSLFLFFLTTSGDLHLALCVTSWNVHCMTYQCSHSSIHVVTTQVSTDLFFMGHFNMPSMGLSLCLTSCRSTACWAQLLPTHAFFLPSWLPLEWCTKAQSKCRLFLPQILTLITGKGTHMKMNTDQEDAFLQWRWPSEPSGERPPSTGTELFPFSKEKARVCTEVWGQSCWGAKPNLWETISLLQSSFTAPWKTPLATVFIFCLCEASALAIGVVGDTWSFQLGLYSQRRVSSLSSKEKMKSLSSMLFPN